MLDKAKCLLRVAGAAVSAAAVSFPMLFAARPKTPLRVGCVAVFEYLARLEGAALSRRRRSAIAQACDFGSLRDEYYDERKFDRTEYRSLRNALRQVAPAAATALYILELRKAERGRPAISGGADATREYREAVIRVSLEWMRAIAGVSVDSARFDSMTNLVCLMQLVDDLLDWKDDQADSCPSYVTALLDAPNRAKTLRALAETLLRRTTEPAQRDPAALPFALAGVVTWAGAAALIKARFPRWTFCANC